MSMTFFLLHPYKNQKHELEPKLRDKNKKPKRPRLGTEGVVTNMIIKTDYHF
jgi:hypothetical protein